MKKALFVLCLSFTLIMASFAVEHLSVTGDFQSKVVGQTYTNWASDQGPMLTDGNGDGIYDCTVQINPAGSYGWKITPEDDWSGDFPGSDQAFTSTAPNENVTWWVNFGANLLARDGDEFAICSLTPPVAAGNFQNAIGGSGDWDVSSGALTRMHDDGADGDAVAGDHIWSYRVIIPEGNYEWKAALNFAWTFNTGSNRHFRSNGVDPITFTFNLKTGESDEQGDIPMAPIVTSIEQSYDTTWLLVKFNQSVKQASAETTANYNITGGIAVQSATLAADKSTVALKVNPGLTPGTIYTVSVSNIESDPGGIIMSAPQDTDVTGKTLVTFTFNNNKDKHPFDNLKVKGEWDGWATHDMYDDGSSADTQPLLPGIQPSGDTAAGDYIWTRSLLIAPGDYSNDGYAYMGSDAEHTFEWPELFSENFGRASTDGAFVVGTSPINRHNVDMVDNWWSPFASINITFIVECDSLSVDPNWVSIQGNVPPFDWTPGSNKMTHVSGRIYKITLPFLKTTYSPVEYKYTADLPAFGEQWEEFSNSIHNRLISLYPDGWEQNDVWGTWSAYLTDEPEPPTAIQSKWNLYQ